MNVRQTMVVALLLLLVKMCQEPSTVNVLLDMNSKREKTALVRHLCVYILKLVKNRMLCKVKIIVYVYDDGWFYVTVV